jgi:hypothetical protein
MRRRRIIASGGITVGDAGRQIEDHLYFFEGNQFQPLATIVVVGCDAFGICLPELMVAKLLLETGCGRRRWV